MKKNSQYGASLVEVLMAISILGIGIAQVGKLANDNQLNTKYKLAAEQHRAFTAALERYAKDNFTTLLGSGSTTAKTITVADLIAAKKLPTGFYATTPLGQTLCGLYSVPASNTLDLLAVSEGGQAIGTLPLKKIAATIGHFGGGVYTSGIIEGTGSTWSVSNATSPTYANFQAASCTGTPFNVGSVASYIHLDSSTLTSDFLRRTAVTGLSSATAMNSPLGLAVKVSGSPCGSTSGDSSEENRITIDSSGNILVCKSASGSWSWTSSSSSSYLKNPVASYAALPSSSNTTGDVRVTLDTTRAFFWTGTQWKPLAVDSSGNLNIPGGRITLGTSTIDSSSSKLDLRTPGTLTITDTTGSNAANISASTVTPVLSITAGSSCSSYNIGAIAKNSAGDLLSCSSSYVWKSSGSTFSSYWGSSCAYNAGSLITLSSSDLSCTRTAYYYVCADGLLDYGVVTHSNNCGVKN